MYKKDLLSSIAENPYCCSFLRAGLLARDLYNNDADVFLKAVLKMNACSNVQANSIDGITVRENIAKY